MMTWFFKATSLLLLLTLGVWGNTLWMCKQDCKDEPDDPVCGRWNFTMEDQHRTKSADYEWLRNECERKCFQRGKYERADMEFCTKDGQNHSTYLCDKHKQYPKVLRRCIRNESLYADYN